MDLKWFFKRFFSLLYWHPVFLADLSLYICLQDAYDAGECGLDECGGRTVNGSYGYYTNGVLPYIPNCRMGTKGSVCGFTP